MNTWETISNKLELAEEKWNQGSHWDAEDIQGSAYNDIERIFNHFHISEDTTLSDIVKDTTFDEYTLIVQIKETISINIEALSKLNNIFNHRVSLHFGNGHLFIYIDFANNYKKTNICDEDDYDRLMKLKAEIKTLERRESISWREHMGDTAKLNTLRKQHWELLSKMNGREYNKEILKSLHE